MAIRKKGIRFSTKIVTASVIATTLYVVAMFWVVFTNIQEHTNVNVPDTLTTLFFAFWTIELVSLSTIEKTKVRNKYHKEEDEEDGQSRKQAN